MSLRCSLLGHEYGETEIERDREERGNEVVISVVELERCTRCDATRTISENTEVTQLSQPRSGTGTGPAGPGPASPKPKPDPTADAESTGPGIESRPEADSRTEPQPDTEPSVEADPAAEDTEIIEDDTVENDREPGAWPEVGDHETRTNEPSETPWPSVEGEDEGFDATTPDGPTDVEFGGGLTPQADQDAEIVESAESGGEDEPMFVSAQSSAAPDRPADLGSEAVLFCPHCEVSGLGDRDSLRAGDICPECHRGYLAEREP